MLETDNVHLMILTVTSKQRKNGSVLITSVLLRCDGCQREYESRKRSRDIKNSTHWCSRKCFGIGMRSGGHIRNLAEKTWLKNWGTTTPVRHPDVEAKRLATCQERFGTTSPMQVDDFKKLRRQNNIQKYGVENPACLASTIDKMHQTNIERYGAKSPLKHPVVYNRVNWTEAVRKNHETMKRNGSYRKSRAEDRMYELLLKQFNTTDVERQCKPKGTNWPIDFYVKSIDTWIQVDGVYWHGLDRPIEEHVTSNLPRSLSIIGKWHVDRAQDAWLAERNMKLVRVTDKQVNAATSLNDLLPECFPKV